PKALMAWFWPGSFDTQVTADVRVGGAYRISSTAADMAVSGHYRELAPPTRLVMTWRWDGDDRESLVTIELSAVGDGTELRLQHRQLVDDHDRDQHEQGWNDCLDRLMSHLR
ncbi:MAG TPA: SRPBCC family protein, partial [Micromonosporaceae bacterium]